MWMNACGFKYIDQFLKCRNSSGLIVGFTIIQNSECFDNGNRTFSERFKLLHYVWFYYSSSRCEWKTYAMLMYKLLKVSLMVQFPNVAQNYAKLKLNSKCKDHIRTICVHILSQYILHSTHPYTSYGMLFILLRCDSANFICNLKSILNQSYKGVDKELINLW